MRVFSATLIIVVTLSTLAHAEKLVFKDGTVEEVEYYRIEGKKVIFKSPERGLEEVPLDMVDLNATETRNKQEPSPHQSKGPDAEILTKQEREALGGKSGLARKRSREIAPGLALPDPPGIYLYDKEKGFQLIPQHHANIETDKGRKIVNLAGAPFLKQRKVVSLPGPTSSVRTTANQPVLYIEPAEKGTGKFVLFRLKSKPNRREVAEVMIDMKGQAEKKQERVPITIKERGNGILEISPMHPLAAGEYGLAELAEQDPFQPGKVNIEIVLWDFGLDKS